MSNKQMIKHYRHLIAILLWTAFFGVTLFFQRGNIIDQIDLFTSTYVDYLIGTLMIALPLIKAVAVYKSEQELDQGWGFIKKWSLIGIAVIWLVITWAYLFNDVPNVGYVMSSFLAYSAYAELGRGDFGY